jgi:DNA-binding response OmpR family regulator
MNKTRPSDSQWPDSGTNNTGQVVSDAKIKSITSNSPQHKRILVVDDDFDIAFTLRLGLEESDPTMQVHSFDNPLTALLEFKPDFYDLMLIDVNMPLMDGFQLTHKLLQKDVNVRVCFMTSGEINMAAAREVHPLKSIGCFIKKPISTEQLVKRVNEELE